MIFFYLVTIYSSIANEIVKRDGIDGKIVPPMTCLGGTVDPDDDAPSTYCPVSDEYYLYISFVHIICACNVFIWYFAHIMFMSPSTLQPSSLKTRFYIWFNVFYALSLYFVLGCLEMQHVLSKIWETGLVLGNYRSHWSYLWADTICRFKTKGIGWNESQESRRFEDLPVDKAGERFSEELRCKHKCKCAECWWCDLTEMAKEVSG